MAPPTRADVRMQGPIIAGLVAGLVIGSTGNAVLSQDDATGAEPPDAARVEAAEAGVAMSFPGSWNVDVEMREREDFWLSDRFPDAAPVLFWSVLYASDGGWPCCDLAWYPEHPTSLAQHATDYEALMTPTGAINVERSIEVTPLELVSGEAYRFVIYNEPSDDFTTTYLLADGVAHYLLSCVSDERDTADWLPLVESMELLGVDQTAAPDATAQS